MPARRTVLPSTAKLGKKSAAKKSPSPSPAMRKAAREVDERARKALLSNEHAEMIIGVARVAARYILKLSAPQKDRKPAKSARKNNRPRPAMSPESLCDPEDAKLINAVVRAAAADLAK